MAKKDRTIITFECKACSRRNYSKMVSKKRKFGKLILNKYCSNCRAHSEHKETK